MTTQALNVHAQRGVALVISLVFLLLLTLLGLVAVRTTTLEESMANNMQDRMMAFQAAEAALRGGEQVIMGFLQQPNQTTGVPDQTNEVWATNAMFDPTDPEDSILATKDAGWWQSNSRPYAVGLSDINTPPRYILEFQAYKPDSLRIGHKYGQPTGRDFYRVSARGSGITDDPQVVVRTTITKRFN